ncbi:hypothetical protein Slin14017_G092000 [Septoria linicola]|nr:hypothetical protein Slin14017_G092000 [Septoria linicola]
MADANDLIAELTRLGLTGQPARTTDDEQRAHITSYPRRHPHHEIKYEFPALDLVRGADEVILPEPMNIDLRLQPDASKYHLNQFQSRYSLSMDPKACEEDLDVRDAHQDVLALLTILDRLANYEGESTLSVATYVTEGHMQFRVRLESVVAGKRNVYDTELSDQDFAALLLARRPWIQLLEDVVYRASARSFIAAEVSIMAQDISFYMKDMLRWQNRWSIAQPRVDLQLIMRGDAVEVTKSPNEDVEVFHLACGHSIRTTAEELQNLQHDTRARFRCADCDDQAAWESLDDQVDQTEEETLSTQALLGILIATT